MTEPAESAPPPTGFPLRALLPMATAFVTGSIIGFAFLVGGPLALVVALLGFAAFTYTGGMLHAGPYGVGLGLTWVGLLAPLQNDPEYAQAAAAFVRIGAVILVVGLVATAFAVWRRRRQPLDPVD